jgi:transposase-like protein
MTRRGRKPSGAQLVDRLAGSAHAKGRLKIILETLSGQKPIPQACAELGIQESMFHKMRCQMLQTAVDRLEPRPAGRKPQLTTTEAQRIAELEAELTQTRVDLKAAEIRRELAETLPRLGRGREPGKKTTRSHATHRRKKRRS